MKKGLFILVLVGLGAFAFRAPLESFLKKRGVDTSACSAQVESLLARLKPERPAKPPRLTGTYVERRACTPDSPPFVVRFIDDQTVDILRGRDVITPSKKYSIRGDRVRIPHRCGTWVFLIQQDGLYHTDFKRLFVRERY